ncbi:1-phosphofructokinase [Candidatus Lokiarchaeum ossiferum]|uniref:1-phosphofructokinase n=1 Tax=Candidatus Lokiarchaeum ossiferum TaxID=2951803 RepID=A0ABY6HRB3_9ARCH|nr:1-phosphofructokinase [Candidatus Lokiarchaeum sp. B-35]
MIYCILLNPSIDKIIEIQNFKLGGTYQLPNPQVFPVGKAISVALTLKELHISTHIVALIGQLDIKLYKNFLESKEINHTLIAVEGKTRTNMTLIDSINDASTHLRFSGFDVTAKNLSEINSFLRIMIQKNDIVVFSGSLPPGTPSEYFLEPSEIIRNKNAKLIIDSSGERLKLMKMYNPYIIKANLQEMAIIVNKKLCTKEDFDHQPTEEELYTLLDLCSELNEYKSKFNVLTLGKYGALIFNRKEAYYGKVTLEKSAYTIGCGDAFLGGLISGLINKYEMKAILRIATICGAANTLQIGPGCINQTDITNLESKCQIQKLR